MSISPVARFGKRYEGIVFVNAVRHDIKEANWLIEVEFCRPDSLALGRAFANFAL